MKTNLLCVLFAGATAALFLPSCKEGNMTTSDKIASVGDATFAKNTFTALARGDQSVSGSIDWKTLQFVGTDVGAAYVAIASEEDQRRMREGFITQFSAKFIAAGGKVEDFGGWKVVEHDATHSVVTAVSPAKILRITVNNRDGKERVSGLQVTELTAP